MYATTGNVQERCRRTLTVEETALCAVLLEDAAVIIDAYNADAPADAKKVVSCNMVLRAIGDGEDGQVPIGSTQGTLSALGYSQTWSLGSGSVGELYLSKLEKKLLGVGNKAAFYSPLEDLVEESE